MESNKLFFFVAQMISNWHPKSQRFALPKIPIEPENDGLEDAFPF